MVVRFRGALVTVESMRGEYARHGVFVKPVLGRRGSGALRFSPGEQPVCRREFAVLRLPNQARLPYSSFRGAPQPGHDARRRHAAMMRGLLLIARRRRRPLQEGAAARWPPRRASEDVRAARAAPRAYTKQYAGPREARLRGAGPFA